MKTVVLKIYVPDGAVKSVQDFLSDDFDIKLMQALRPGYENWKDDPHLYIHGPALETQVIDECGFTLRCLDAE